MRLFKTKSVFTALCAALSLGVAISAHLNAAETSTKKQRVKTIVRPSFDPTAEKVDLFSAMEEGEVDAFVVPHNEHHGYIYVENKSEKPVSVKLPRTIVAVQNLKQFGGGGFGGGQQGGGFGGQQGGGFGGGQQGGGQGIGGGQGGFGGQQGGGGFGGQQGGGFGGQQGGGFFSIPPQHRVKLELNTVCLEHGKKSPSRTMKYSLVPAEKAIQNDTLYELLSMVGTGRIPERVGQAAAWYLTDGMSFQQLAAKQEVHFGGARTPYFTQQDLLGAQKLLMMAKTQADQRRAALKSGNETLEIDPYYERDNFKTK